ncbi:MAG: hydantoinase/oxoprolinase family protein [Hyphomicrobiaceae bacterium]
MSITAGLDVGGAHLKVALVERGKAIAVEQYVCPLWQGLDKLDAALADAAPLTARAHRIAVTMTGELSDLFESRAEGVARLVGCIADAYKGRLSFWLGQSGLGATADARAKPHDVGSTNFLATAHVVAARHGNALLLDFGSTTADIIPIVGGRPAPTGLTDAERQRTGELVYTGFTRTAVMGVTTAALFKGQWTTLAREYLATMADVRRVLDELEDGLDLHATADGRGKSVGESVARLARMLGREAADGTLDDWRATARGISEIQLRSIHDGVLQVVSRHPTVRTGPLVAAGIGADIAFVLARRTGLEPVAFGDLIDAAPTVRRAATHSAPAVAVALLADRSEWSDSD